jgi:hypothetical protein
MSEPKRRGRPRKVIPQEEMNGLENLAGPLLNFAAGITELEKKMTDRPESIELPSQEEVEPLLEVAEKIDKIVNPPTQSLDNQLYNSIEVEDDEEEDFIVDLANGKVYSLEEHLILMDSDNENKLIIPQQASFQAELTNLFIDRIAEVSIRKMLRQYDEILDQAENAFKNTVATDKIRDTVRKTVEAERRELKRCYNGVTINYDLIPDFAKEEIKWDMRKVVETLLELSS